MNRQELKFDAKNKMREAAVNPYVVTLILGVILMVLSGVQFILDFWGNIYHRHGIFRKHRGSRHVYRIFSRIFCHLLSDQHDFTVWIQQLLPESGKPGWVHVLWRFVFIGSLSAESHRTDAYDIGFCPALVYTACNTGYHCGIPLFPGHLHHG